MERAGTVARAAVVLALIVGTSRPAAASGFSAARFGGEQGNVTTTNPTALYYNPAGIAYSEGITLFVDGTLALRHATWEHAPAPTDMPEPAGAEGATFGKAQLFNVFGGPMFGATARLGRLALGAAFMVPFGGRAHWSTNDKFKNDPTFPLAVDGVQRWNAIDGALTFLYFTVGAAYRFNRWSIGVTGNLIRSSITSTQAKSPVGFGDPDVTREGRAAIDVSGFQGSFGAGVMVEAIERRLWLGAGYQAQPALGAMTLDGTLRTTYAGGATVFNVGFHQALPDSLRVGARFRASPRLEVRLSGELTRWSVMQSQCVGFVGEPCLVDTTGADATPQGTTIQNLRRKWKDTYGVRLGASDWVRPAVELFAGLGFETAAVPDATMDPGLADANNLAGAVGARVQVTPTLFVAASYTQIQYFDRDNTGASQLANALPPTRLPDGGGKYTQWIGLFNVNLQKQF
ncbi:MAG TPA: outer membrane protein transport protein [Polyangia bacterium]